MRDSAWFVRNHKMVLTASLLIIGGTFLYRTNQEFQTGSGGSAKEAVFEKVNASYDWHFRDLFYKGPVMFVWSMFWARHF